MPPSAAVSRVHCWLAPAHQWTNWVDRPSRVSISSTRSVPLTLRAKSTRSPGLLDIQNEVEASWKPRATIREPSPSELAREWWFWWSWIVTICSTTPAVAALAGAASSVAPLADSAETASARAASRVRRRVRRAAAPGRRVRVDGWDTGFSCSRGTACGGAGGRGAGHQGRVDNRSTAP
ncbi:hypothetical protein VM95_11805 [Streptomyces rubellomurinus]|uniref:Uncharacterized protein n=1 Tax=Streptomyces rubellomurinus (strain ATCC 31215) TaxID=359131 RepID=A0A0F2TIB5_STRR3|nr:hypothetical protein VM95_11805 [Streptomyces rubellomurinus]